ncbi:MAG TPA: cyclic nucleotide-binding domain-containing protein [Bryobacterales bacterium]|nr:cyclic nucleotide-binding domain-containing protein [Bryobacterales bacterium]
MAKDVILPADLGGTPMSPEELAAIPDFSGIRKEIWGKFPGAIARKDYRPGEILFHEGDSGTTAFYLLSGEVEIYLASPVLGAQSRKRASHGLFRGITKITSYVKGIPDRSEKNRPVRTHIPIDGSVDLPLDNPIATLKPGELFGELAALAAFKQEKLKRPKFYPRSATVRARTEVTVLEMLPNILNNVLYNSPAFKKKLDDSYRGRALDNHLRSVPVFRNLSQEFLDYLRQRVELVDFPPGQVICKQGEIADAFYLIRLGFVKVSQEFPGGEMVLAYLSRGSYFGEMGLLPPAFRARAKGGNAGQLAEAVVSREPLPCGRAPAGERVLAVPWDEYISREHFELRVDGKQVRVTRLAGGKNPITFRGQAAETILISPGESFLVGGTTFEVLEDPFQAGLRTATCTAVDFVQLVRIKAEDFAKMLHEFPEVDEAITEVARARRQMDAQILNRVQTLSLNDFLKQELMQGQNLLLLDLNKCTRCDECVKACVATHEDGVTRLIRDGLRFDKYLVATSCRACMDPLCMTRCPVGSIRRKETLDIVIEDWCIGCGNCATDCPYGNINVVELAGRGGGKSQKAEPRPKAVVCDLCVDYPEPNCVRACPHDAAIRVEPKTFFARDLAGMQLAVPLRAPEAAAEAPAGDETRILSNVAELLPLLPRLQVRSGPRAGAVLQLRYPATTFGRAPEADYRFAENEQISRVHCSIVCENNRFVLRDNNSTNGTLVNGNPVAEIELRAGDVIQIGDLEMEFLAREAR